MNTITSSGFFTQVLGEVSHPINIVREYLEAFGNKCKASILTWLDSWTRTKIAQGKDTWIWERQRNLAKELGYNKETINIHLNQLIDLGIIEAALQTPNSCSRLLKYRLNIDNLAAFLTQSGFTSLNRKSGHGKPESRTTENGNPDSNLNHSLNSNIPNSTECEYNNSDDVLTRLEEFEINLNTQEEEQPQDSRTLDIPKPKLREKTQILHEDHSCGAAGRVETNPDLEFTSELIQDLGITLNPKLKRFLAAHTAEEVLKAIAAYYFTLEVKQTTVESPTGFIIDATRNNYIENTEIWISADKHHRDLMLLAAGSMAMGMKLQSGFYGATISREIAFFDKDGNGKQFDNERLQNAIAQHGYTGTLMQMWNVYAQQTSA